MRCMDLIFTVVFVFLFHASNNLSRYQVDAARHRRHNHHHNQQQLTQQPQQPQQQQSNNNDSNASTLNNFSPELMMVRRIYDDCQDKNDFVNCLKQKALVALSRALDKDSIKVVDGLVLEKQNQTETESVIGAFTDARSLSSMSALDKSLLSKLDKLMRTHALKIDMSTGRGHKEKKHDKKGGSMKYVIAALVTAMGIAGPLGLKALAAVAIKALVISKVALTIASIIALKKLFAHDGHEETSFQVHAGDHNRRSTYVVRPVTKASAMPASQAAMSASSVEPYRYYYEYH